MCLNIKIFYGKFSILPSKHTSTGLSCGGLMFYVFSFCCEGGGGGRLLNSLLATSGQDEKGKLSNTAAV